MAGSNVPHSAFIGWKTTNSINIFANFFVPRAVIDGIGYLGLAQLALGTQNWIRRPRL